METAEIQVSDSRRHNFTIIDNEIFQVYGPRLGPSGIAVYSYLAFRSRSGVCRVLVTTVARDLGMGERAVREVLRALDEDLHLVNRKRTFGGASSYTLVDIKNLVSSLPTKRQDLPECTKRQDLPQSPALNAAQSGTTCLQNKTLLNTRSEINTELDEKPVLPSSKKVSDSRFSETQKLISLEYKRVNGAECPWQAAEAKQLSIFLQSVPHWTMEQIGACVCNRFKSFSPSDAPKKWLGSLADYLSGPKTYTARKVSAPATAKAAFPESAMFTVSNQQSAEEVR